MFDVLLLHQALLLVVSGLFMMGNIRRDGKREEGWGGVSCYSFPYCLCGFHFIACLFHRALHPWISQGPVKDCFTVGTMLMFATSRFDLRINFTVHVWFSFKTLKLENIRLQCNICITIKSEYNSDLHSNEHYLLSSSDKLSWKTFRPV